MRKRKICNKCGKTFTRQTTLSEHKLRRHSGIDCNKNFVNDKKTKK